jgi:hypothetical protein
VFCPQVGLLLSEKGWHTHKFVGGAGEDSKRLVGVLVPEDALREVINEFQNRNQVQY